MIYYNEEQERWEDDTNKFWFVSMSPDYNQDVEKTFKTKDDFHKWYFGDFNNG